MGLHRQPRVNIWVCHCLATVCRFIELDIQANWTISSDDIELTLRLRRVPITKTMDWVPYGNGIRGADTENTEHNVELTRHVDVDSRVHLRCVVGAFDDNSVIVRPFECARFAEKTPGRRSAPLPLVSRFHRVASPVTLNISCLSFPFLQRPIS